MKNRFIRVVSDVVPKTRKVFDAINIPWAINLTPYLDEKLHRVQYPKNSIIRCLSCNSYLSLYCHIDYDTKTWKCPLCSYDNSIPEDYFQIMTPNSPELTLQNYEIFAEEKYMERAPMCPFYLFLIDISSPSIELGFFHATIECIGKILEYKSKSIQNENHELRTQVSFILFGDHIHLITNKLDIVEFKLSLSEPWLPYPVEEFVFDFIEDYSKIVRLLSKISKTQGDGLGRSFKKSLRASQLILESNGGKILTFLCNPMQESLHPKKLSFLPRTDYYHKLGQELVSLHISVDLFMSGNRFCGFNAYSELSKLTGGQIFYYTINLHFSPTQTEEFFSDLSKVLLEAKGWESVLRLRVSTEWKVYNQYGHFDIQKDLIHIPCCQNLTITFDLAPKLFENSDNFVTFQGSLLYTSSDGIRIIRVFNYQVFADDNIDEIIKSINSEVLVNLYLKHAVSLAFKRSVIFAAGKYLETKMIDMMKVCIVAFNSMPGNLQDFSARMLGLIKHEIFENPHIPYNSALDHFTCVAMKLMTLSPKQTSTWSYPKLLNSSLKPLKLTKRLLKQDLYILDDGMKIVIFFSIFHKDTTKTADLEDLIKSQIQALRYSGGLFQEIITIDDISSLNSQAFWKRLIEDRFGPSQSLHEFESMISKVAHKRL